ncbi:MAG: hypothetical protein ACTSYT_02170 [Candidatus Asgardarchaeia archaeon]
MTVSFLLLGKGTVISRDFMDDDMREILALIAILNDKIRSSIHGSEDISIEVPMGERKIKFIYNSEREEMVVET